ncbi:MAG: 23S rRNA (guanosine(2251)-2'-O)-methyltransferase RlmB [Synechococcus sp. Baikal-G1]|nr:MAG: 23S rRNA (guanosine(2251)-2'-O)-methyltransferase RlmB [Synechococcus sp. Baikal-G1]
MVRPGRPRLDGPRFDKPRFDKPRFEGSRPEGRSGDGDSGDFRPGPRRFDGNGSMGEGRPGGRRPFAARPDGAARRERGPGAFSPGEPAPEGRFSSSRPEGRRFAGAGASRGSFGRPSFGRPAFGGSAAGRPSFPRPGGAGPRGAFQPARPDRPVVVDAPTGESETFGSSPADDMIWGRHPALAALESGRPIHRIWCTAEMRFTPKFLQLLREAKSAGVLVEEVTWARLGQLTAGAVHQGIALQAAAAETLDLDSLISGCRDIGEPPLLMAVDGLTDPHNLGAIVRSAEALGAHGLVLPQRRSAGLTGSVAKVAAGALEYLPVARVVNLNRSLETLKQEGYRVVGLAEEGSVTLAEADLDGPLVVVTGSEGSGLSMLTRRYCDQLVRIPLRGATPSLNASVATALLLYEVARRGWMKTITGSSPAPRIVRPNLPTPSRRVASEPEAESPSESAAGSALAGDVVLPPSVEGDLPGGEPAGPEPRLEPGALAPDLPGPDSQDLDPGQTSELTGGFDQDILL